MGAVPTRPAGVIVGFLGGAGTVTGSRFLVETPGARVLVDCGLFQGMKELRQRNWLPFPVDPASVDAVVLTHAHVDHCGYLPALARDGFRGPIVASHASVALSRIVLPDSAHLQEEEAAYANRVGYSRHHPAKPLYTTADAEAAMALLHGVPFGRREPVAPGVEVELHSAGHILGSAIATLFVDGAPVLACSGDLGRPHHPLLRPPCPPPAVPALIVESTYGNRRHPPGDESRDRLADAIRRTAERGGTVVVPAFAVDRTEVVLHELRALAKAGAIPSLPIYVDSPMALAALRVYRRAIERGDPEVRDEIRTDGDPFDPGTLVEIHDVEESIALNDQRYPCIIVSASGMATGGRILHHLHHRIGDPRNTVLLAGFQAVGTRGRALLDGAPTLKLLGRYEPVRAEIVDLTGFSVHADADELVAWLGSAPSPPRHTFVVHGEPEASDALQRRVRDDLRWDAVVARMGERVRIG